jgi:integrase
LSTAVELYLAHTYTVRLAAKTILEKKRCLELLKVSLGAGRRQGEHRLVHNITTSDISAFQRTLSATPTQKSAQGHHPATQAKTFGHLNAFFAFLTTLGALITNPMLALEPARLIVVGQAHKHSSSYRPFTYRELKSILDPTSMLLHLRSAAQFWMLLLALTTGARAGSLARVTVNDVHIEQGTGVWYIELPASKGRASRPVPIASVLLEIGFGAYVDRLREVGRRFLLRPDRVGKMLQIDPGRTVSRAQSAYLRALHLHLQGRLKGHSCRATWITLLHLAGTPLADAMAMVGHSAGEHALSTGEVTATQLRSAHLNVYMQPDVPLRQRETALQRRRSYVDAASRELPLDVAQMNKAAAEVLLTLVGSR